ncbi:MFS general substrate transporter [Zopfia rhizophila CBS 207.26]|uniref:MFS general substrate transporter n=1 Tax=Zopfia rhizophila CBS 207.26 TaxID=1314779 RepID=A0A6A6EHL3_9PEZI|nr:MFS general substrate transporter [Zopfia rhizophila CBS 207.26]
MFGKNRKSSPKTDPDKDSKYLSPLPLTILFLGLCLTAILIVLYMTVIGTAIPSITTYFGTVEDVDWYATAYLLTVCAIQPLTGQIYNYFPVKATYITFISIFELGTLICALAKSSKAFIVGRAVAGMGGAGLFNGSMVMITAAAPPKVRPLMISISVAMVGIGGVIGPVVGGAVTEHLGWRWCLWIFMPPGLAVAAMFLFQRIPEQVSKPTARSVVRNLHHKLDLIGFALFTPSCVMFLFAMSWGGSKYAWKSAMIIGLFCGSVGIACIFGLWIWHRKERALIPPSLIMKPVVFFGCLVSFLQGGAFLMIGYYLPLWFQSVKGASPGKSGVMLLPTCISQIVASIACSALLRPIPYASLWALLGNIVTAIGSGLMTTFQPDTSSSQWIGYQILGGAGRGIAMQMPILAAQEALPSSEVAIATANLLFFQYFGGSVLNSVAKTIFLNGLQPALNEYAPSVDAEKVIHSGVTELLKSISPKDMVGVVKAYNKALTLTFWLPTAAACIGCFLSLGLGWQKIGFREKVKNNKAASIVSDGGEMQEGETHPPADDSKEKREGSAHESEAKAEL